MERRRLLRIAVPCQKQSAYRAGARCSPPHSVFIRRIASLQARRRRSVGRVALSPGGPFPPQPPRLVARARWSSSPRATSPQVPADTVSTSFGFSLGVPADLNFLRLLPARCPPAPSLAAQAPRYPLSACFTLCEHSSPQKRNTPFLPGHSRQPFPYKIPNFGQLLAQPATSLISLPAPGGALLACTSRAIAQ